MDEAAGFFRIHLFQYYFVLSLDQSLPSLYAKQLVLCRQESDCTIVPNKAPEDIIKI